jgi:hypothetical protein
VKVWKVKKVLLQEIGCFEYVQEESSWAGNVFWFKYEIFTWITAL